jgi:coenzyme F420-reducing hydrogenase alpha subunit
MMKETITIDPVTRIEGHAKITIQLDDAGAVSRVRFQVKEFRGFEKFCEGALAERLPLITSRICGLCPVSHHIASTKAVEDCFNTEVSSATVKLRELLLLGQVIESHMFSLILLSLPDLHGQPPTAHSIVDLYQEDPATMKRVLDIRSVGTDIIHAVGRRPGHPIGAIIGGMVAPLMEEECSSLLHTVTEAESQVSWFSEFMRSLFKENDEIIHALGDIESSYMSLSDNNGLTFYDGSIQVIKEDGSRRVSFDPHQYFDHIQETYEPWSYMKFSALESDGGFRVGPLARLNIADSLSTPLAHSELTWFRNQWSHPVHKTLTYHYARFIEVLYALERSKELLNDPEITSQDIYTQPEMRGGIGIGVVEAPRGTLIHRYHLDEQGKAEEVTLVVSTQHNNYGLNESLTQAGKKILSADNMKEGDLHKLEMIVRAYDPCISCSTHGIDDHRFLVQLMDHQGTVLKEWR